MDQYSMPIAGDLPADFTIDRLQVDSPVPLHSHDYLELAYILKGWTRHTLNGKSQRLKAGQYMILDYSEVHSYDVVSENLIVINCLFKPSVVDIALSDCCSFRELLSHYMINIGYTIGPSQSKEKIFFDSDGEILLLLQKIQEEYQNKKTGYRQLIRSSLIEIIIKTMRKMEDKHLSVMKKYDENMMQIVLMINQNPNTADSLSELAARLNMSVGNLSRRFRLATGYRFSEYLQKKRIEQACRLLINTREKIPEIALQSGYSDLKFFNRIFKKNVGETPTQYRKRFSKNGKK